MAREDLERLSPEGGKFRSWLLRALKNHCSNVDAGERASKRGGDATILSLEIASAEESYSLEPVDEGSSAEDVFRRRWAMCLIERATSRLRSEAEERDRLELFDRSSHLIAGGESGAFDEIGNELDMEPGTVKVAVHRWRRRFRELVRLEVAETVADAADIESELCELRDALN